MKMQLRIKIERLDAALALLAANDLVKVLQEEYPFISELERLQSLIVEAGDAFRLEEVTDWGSDE